MRVDWRIAAVTLIAAFVAAAMAFVRPVTSGRVSLDTLLRRTAADVRASHRVRSTLVAVQVAIGVVLLVAAGLLGRTVANLRDIRLGFEPDRLLTFALDPHLHGYEAGRLDRLAREVETRLLEESGGRPAGFISPAPLRSSFVTAPLYRGSGPEEQPLIGGGFFVTPGFLPTLGARVIAGEAPWRADSGTAVITRGTLAKLFPGMSPAAIIGQMVATRPNNEHPVRIAAVIEDLHLSQITDEPPPLLFRPLAERYAGMSLMGIVQGVGAPTRLVPVVERVLSCVAPELPVFDVRTARAAVDLQFADRHAIARAALTLGGIGMVLAIVGLYGVLAAVVAGRRREIGIRSALGASPTRILRRVIGSGMVPVLFGVPLGLMGAAFVSKLLAPQLFGVTPVDARVRLGAVALIVLAAAAASLVPAYRAMRVSPAEVLRED